MNEDEDNKQTFCMFLDLETGGFNPKTHAICELGFLVFNTRTYEVVSKSVVKIKPYFLDAKTHTKAEYTQSAFKTNRYSQEELERTGFKIENILRLFDEVIRKYEIVYFGGHNVENFDIRFLQHVYRIFMGKEFTYKQAICTLAMARRRIELKSYSLTSLCEHFKLEPKKMHTAMADTEASYEVFQLLRNLPDRQPKPKAR